MHGPRANLTLDNFITPGILCQKLFRAPLFLFSIFRVMRFFKND